MSKKILIVDDNITNLYTLTALLEDSEFLVESAEGGHEAIAILKNSSDIDLVLMDIMMPVMGGFEAIGIIRNDPKLKDTPIIALTAKAMKGDREECLEAGADGYCSKPVDADVLLEEMHRLM